MSRLTLTQKTAFGAVLMISCIAGLVLWCWAAVGELTSRGTKATSYRVPQIERLADIEVHVTRASLALRHALLARDGAEHRAAVEDVRERMNLASRTMEAIDRGAVTPGGRNAVEVIRPAFTTFAEVGGRTLAMVEDRSNRDAFGFLVEHAVPARNALLEHLHAERQRQFLALDEEFAGLAKEADGTRIVIAVLGSLLVVGMVVGAFAVVNVIRGLGTDPSDLKAVVADIANGELARKLAPREGDDTSVLAGIERMRGQLSDAVGRVRRCADQVATAGAQIAGGNQDLAVRTERQAMALQQTAASTEELGATVKLNAENARKAASLATSCSTLAIDGGQRVREAVETMRTIEDGSRKIGDILSVIDGIAFQTNILALNAAVEAARAGQQGRGFAVVATEVRELAQRSAGAAREIRSLIVDSTGRVERGVSIVGQAGAKMDDVVAAIRRLESLVAAIAAASGEQSEGVEQVGHAVADMDRVVQQNVALVEQSTAAATSLQSQSDELVRAVSTFRLA